MKKKELAKTKKKLTIIFTLIIFFLVTVLGFSYFVFKYFSEKKIDNLGFNNFVYSFETGKIDEKRFLNINEEFKNFKRGEKFGPGFDRGISFISLDKNNEVIFSDLKFNITNEYLEKILDLDENKKYYFSNFIVQIVENEDGKKIFIKNYRYSLNQFLQDLLYFLILNLLFSIIFYLIGIKFVNKIFKPVEENISEMKNFIHNSGHELKTPISVIDSNIQLMLEMKVYDEEMIKELKTEVLKLSSLLDSLVKLTEIKSFSDEEEVNLSESIDYILKNFSEKILNKNIKTSKNIPENIFLKINRNYLYIFLSNILGNSIKYNKYSGEINIFYKNNFLIIEDTGIGISQENKEKIFDRFFKCDESRSSDGFGIGLSLVKKIADIYNWKINVISEINKGTKFEIKIK